MPTCACLRPSLTCYIAHTDPEEAAEMRARQQQQASQIFKVQQKQYEPAYLEELDSYIVGEVQLSWGSCP